ncbi:diaminopimelate decarboxylase [Streptomyces sp. NBC_01190]|uniref:diaminopimelate decarboxylase n=1 Tax=Streptomyces sp. NBC_01190 TaxID=2903767 RepID=UPI00386A0FC8|nr:diaminopimelate decarboxylase [Streptomyces sp. NBC_01190]
MSDELGIRRGQALRAAVEQGLASEAEPVVGLLDVTGIEESATALHAAFTTPGMAITHTFAVKAASLVPVLALLGECGLGAEVASPGELALARAAGIPADRTVLDSPAKTVAELRTALGLGIAVNVDNPEELARIDALRSTVPGGGSPVGLRVNPQVGGGSIGAMSTATATSKFGVALRDPGAEEWVLRTYAERPWLNRLHTHTGSQGVPLELMAEGVRAAYDLAERINQAAGRQQVTVLDIGGGLPVNFDSDEITPAFADYAALLRTRVPGLFDGRYGLVTEFGRSLLAKNGSVLARVEYAKSAGGRPIAVTHAGAQVATRTVFVPDAWPIRVLALDGKGQEKSGPPVVQDVAGPCCFAGDLVAKGCRLPLLAAGDHVALLDTGAYYFSNHFAYNSLPRPAVHGYRVREDGGVSFSPVRAAQSEAEVVAESGGGLPPLRRAQ